MDAPLMPDIKRPTDRPQSADAAKLKLPRIILRDPAGLPIDTDTSFQRAIDESRQRLAEARASGGLSTLRLEPNEWRLPHAVAAPARPDYSRALNTERPRRTNLKRTFGELTELAEVSDIDQSAISAHDLLREQARLREWQLLCRVAEAVIGPEACTALPLPPVVSDIPAKAARRLHLPHVAGVQGGGGAEDAAAGRHQRHHTTAFDDKRAVGNLDKSCGGNHAQTGFTLCYGCERCSELHYHCDKLARTGGGFTYFKRDRPLYAIKKNNPLNWKIVYSDGRYVFCDDSGDRRRVSAIIEEPLPEDLFGVVQEMFEAELIRSDTDLHPTTTTPTSVRGDGDYEGQDEKEQEEEEEEVEEEEDEEEKEEFEEEEDAADSGHEASDVESLMVDSGTAGVSGVDELNVDQTADTSEAQAKRKLYKAPEAFKLKQRQKNKTEASLPFSTDRNLNIPKYGNIEIHKSDKKLTEFVDFERGDGTYEAPDAFQLHAREDEEDTRRLGTVPVVQTEQPAKQQVAPTDDRQLTSKQPEQPAKPKHKKTPSPKQAKKPVTVTKAKQPMPIIPVATEERASSPDSGVASVSQPPPLPRPLTPLTAIPSQAASPEAPVDNRQPSAPVPVDVTPSAVSVSTASPAVAAAVTPAEPKPAPANEATVGPRPLPKQPKQAKTEEVQRRRPKAKEPVKKERKQEVVKRVHAKDEEPTPPPAEPKPEKVPTPPPEDVVLTPEPTFEPMVFKEHILPDITPIRPVEHPPLPTASPPSLPKMMDFIEPVKPIREISTTQIEIPPSMMEPPKQRRPPPLLKPKVKPRRVVHPAPTRTVGAPVQVTDMKDIADPLDFLAKYCIIHPDRLPHYVRVFSKAVGEQMYRYSDVPHAAGQFADDDEDPQSVAMEAVKTSLTEDEQKKIREFTVVNVTMKPQYAVIGMNEGDQTLAKINYTLETLMDKYEALHEKAETANLNHIQYLATLARKQFPQIADASYKPPQEKKKKKKKAKKTDSETKEENAANNETSDDLKAAPEPEKLGKPSDKDIIDRLDDKQMKVLYEDSELARKTMELQRLQQKLREVDDRIEELEDEKKLVQLYARDEFQRLEMMYAKSDQFMRQQSALYQRMHPSVNVELNVSDVEEALQEINGHLITKKEMQYIFHILNIPGRKRIDVQLFSVIAALSEKVAQVDPFIRKLINKFDYEALNVKMDRSKELFRLLTENDATDVPLGKIAAQMLAVELAAGGVTEEHTQYVLSKFNRENKGVVDFLDFLTYVPLFIEIHDRILNAPLQLDREW